jgi:hypothetical protein
MAKELDLKKAKKIVRDNLETLRIGLTHSVEEGMIDNGAELYNRILALIDDSSILSSWDEMIELIDQAQILEQDMDAWLSQHGRTSISLPWPKRNSSDNK